MQDGKGSAWRSGKAILKNTPAGRLVCYNILMRYYFPDKVAMGMSISSIEMPPCWNVSRKYCT